MLTRGLDESKVRGAEAVALHTFFTALGAFESKVGFIASFSSDSSPCTDWGFAVLTFVSCAAS